MPSRRAPRAKSARVTRLPAVAVDADQLALMLERAVRAGAAPQASTVTLSELWAWWGPRYLSKIVSGRDFRQRMEAHLLPALGALTEATLTSDAIELRLAELEATLKPGTINHCRNHGRKVVNDCIRANRWSRANPFAATRKRKVPKKVPHVLTPPEARALLAVSAPDIAARWATLLGLGPRLGEFRHVRVPDFDERNQRLTFRKTKTGVERTVPVPGWLMPYLRTAREMTRCEWLFASRGGARQYGKNSKADELLARALRRANIVQGYEHWCGRRTCRATLTADSHAPRHCVCGRLMHCRGIPRKVCVHHLRHAAISMLQEAGAHPGVVQRVVGHAAPNITQGVYTHFSERFMRGELEKLDLAPTEADIPRMTPEKADPRPSKPKVVGSSPTERVNSNPENGRASAPPPLLTIRDVANRLGLKDSAVRDLIHRGRLVGISLGHRYRVSEEDFADFLARSRTDAGGEASP